MALAKKKICYKKESIKKNIKISKKHWKMGKKRFRKQTDKTKTPYWTWKSRWKCGKKHCTVLKLVAFTNLALSSYWGYGDNSNHNPTIYCVCRVRDHPCTLTCSGFCNNLSIQLTTSLSILFTLSSDMDHMNNNNID